MSNDDYQRIKQKYENSRGDSSELFNEILRASTEIGLDEALLYLERCVIEKRSAWLQANHAEGEIEGDPVKEGYKWFYEKYLGVSAPKDGEIVELSENRMVMRWWNPCPTLEACKKLGLDTREICRKVYQRPVEAFLKEINPKLRFSRNYENIRPYAAYCEEIIELED
jgi:hypothetical protein